MEHHRVGLARLTRRTHPADFAKRLEADYTQVTLTPREQVLVDYAAKLTRTPWAMAEEDLQRLREVGLSDRDILDANLITAYFAYVNRIAEGLGVGLET